MKPIIRNVFALISIIAIVASAKMVPTLSRRSADTCGVKKISEGLIVRGKSFPRGTFPWIVALTYSRVDPPQFFGAGTLISSKFVISAAHCIYQKYSTVAPLLPRDVLAFFGAHNLSNYFECERYLLSPKDIILHDKWNSRTTEYDADLSLLEFEEGSIHFNTFVQPICLWYSQSESTETKGIATGWGKSEDPTRGHEDVPKQIEVLIQSNELCLPGEPRIAGISSTSTFCAGLRNGSGVCHGDSGGGLFIKVDDLYYLKGIVSSSLNTAYGCDVTRNAVYTNVVKFWGWIEKKTGAVRKVSCTSIKMMYSGCCGKVKTCAIKQTIHSEDYVIGSGLDNTVEQFVISNNSDVKFLPKHIGENFSNLKLLQAYGCGLTVIRDYYFKDMGNLEVLSLYNNKIASIESNAFNDLISVGWLDLHDNMIATLDEKLFASMVKLEELYLYLNKIIFLSPTTFKIPRAKLRSVDLRSNVCINRNYGNQWRKLDLLEGDLRAKCTQ